MIFQMLILACWALCAALLAAYAASAAGDITYVTLADGRRTERSLPAAMRMLLPFAPNLRRLTARPAFDRQRAAAEGMILAAGLEGLLSADEFLALKYLFPLVFGALWAALCAFAGMAFPHVGAAAVPAAALGVAACWLYPMRWLSVARRRRHLAIMRELPFVLDLLTLSIEAGMDFMSALQRNCARRKVDPLNEELLRVTREIQVGTPRRKALANMAARVGQPDLGAVVHALVQADELGVSVGTVLRIQSEQLRAKRFDRAERLANEAPVKMLGPLMLCIFPSVFIILLGPILMQAAKGVF